MNDSDSALFAQRSVAATQLFTSAFAASLIMTLQSPEPEVVRLHMQRGSCALPASFGILDLPKFTLLHAAWLCCLHVFASLTMFSASQQLCVSHLQQMRPGKGSQHQSPAPAAAKVPALPHVSPKHCWSIKQQAGTLTCI